MCQPSSHTSQMARRIFSPVCLQPPHSLHARHFHVLHRSGRFSSGSGTGPGPETPVRVLCMLETVSILKDINPIIWWVGEWVPEK